MMHDGATRKLKRSDPRPPGLEFFERFQATLVVVEGGAAGSEFPLERARVSIGRGPEVDLAFEDDAMSKEHAVLELADGSFRLRDLASTNGVLLNGSPTLAAELKHGDRIQLGAHTFQFLLEEREREPRTFVLSDSN